jgi:hypothetical protein
MRRAICGGHAAIVCREPPLTFAALMMAAINLQKAYVRMVLGRKTASERIA